MLRAHRKAHWWIWRALCVILPAILIASWLMRPVSRLPDPVQLRPPAETAR